jgi:hypothetical protein
VVFEEVLLHPTRAASATARTVSVFLFIVLF